jgi:hypothetical protein
MQSPILRTHPTVTPAPISAAPTHATPQQSPEVALPQSTAEPGPTCAVSPGEESREESIPGHTIPPQAVNTEDFPSDLVNISMGEVIDTTQPHAECDGGQGAGQVLGESRDSGIVMSPITSPVTSFVRPQISVFPTPTTPVRNPVLPTPVPTPADPISVPTPAVPTSVPTPVVLTPAPTSIPTPAVRTPAIRTPALTPAVRTPASTPDVRTPAPTPPVRTPASTPAVRIPASTPAVRTPASTPAVRTPASTPAVQTPAPTSAVRTPAATPAVRTPAPTPVPAKPKWSFYQKCVDAVKNGWGAGSSS